jgi:hypothetical protein
MTLPKLAIVYLPVLLAVMAQVWPDAPIPSFFPAQIEQETCISLTHSKCWNPRAELKTSREYGFGLGQITRAYRADGSVRFDKFSELRAQHASLRDWQWDNRYDASYQIRALVEMDYAIYRRMVGKCAEDVDCMAFVAAAYNGGEGGLLQDRMMCRNTRGCDPEVWSGNVEHTSTKSRVKWQGYGKSAFEINREYVHNILNVRRAKYVPHVEG